MFINKATQQHAALPNVKDNSATRCIAKCNGQLSNTLRCQM